MFTPEKNNPASIIGQDDLGRGELALETIGRHSVPRALRSVAIALLDVRPASMQRSMCGRKVWAC
jgi:hypothetical protein